MIVAACIYPLVTFIVGVVYGDFTAKKALRNK